MPRSPLLKSALWLAVILATQALLTPRSSAADWPMGRGDRHRSCVTTDALEERLAEAWRWSTDQAPCPAWTESPPTMDPAHHFYNMKPRQDFDRCFEVAVVDDRVYFGSSSGGSVTCLDALRGGREVWTFFTEGPVRFAPCLSDGRVYFGSDDGYVYCLDASDGSLIWKTHPGPSTRRIWGNDQMISVCPVRGGVVAEEGRVYCTAGIFPEEGMYVCCLSAEDGSEIWKTEAVLPPQGYLLQVGYILIVPTGKTNLTVYAAEDGAYSNTMVRNSRDGGSWALVTPEGDALWAGPNVEDSLNRFSPGQQAYLASLPGADRLVVEGASAYGIDDLYVRKIERETYRTVWRVPAGHPRALARAGGKLVVGGDGFAATLDDDGEVLWWGEVNGSAYGVAVAGGNLFISTTAGGIHCFSGVLPAIDTARGATVTAPAAATLRGDLVSTGTSATDVTLYWGGEDGATSPTAWANSAELGTLQPGLFEHAISSLPPESACYYRARAANASGEGWSVEPGTFINGAVRLSPIQPSASEAGGEAALVLVSRPAWSASVPLEVFYECGGDATSGVDYEPLPGLLRMEEGCTTAVLEIAALDDLQTDEGDESLVLALAPGGYLRDAASSVTLTLVEDNDTRVGWTRWCRIDFPGYDGQETLRDFPLPVRLSADIPGLDYAQFASGEGADLRFMDGQRLGFLEHEVESWNPAGESLCWVHVPEFPPEGLGLWACWGRPDAPAPEYTQDGSVWGSDHAGVWHFAQKAPVADATALRNHAIDVQTTATEGLFAGARRFGAGAYCTIDSIADDIDENALTVAGWVRTAARFGSFLSVNEAHLTSLLVLFVGKGFTGEFCIYENRTFAANTETAVHDDQWHHLAYTRTRYEGRLFVDGRLLATHEPVLTLSESQKWSVGQRWENGSAVNELVGRIDELRISRAVRSDNWLRATWAVGSGDPIGAPVYQPVVFESVPAGAADWLRY